MDYMHPLMVEALRGHMPAVTPTDATEPTEAQRLAADLYNMQHKERLRQERALALQIQYGDAQ